MTIWYVDGVNGQDSAAGTSEAPWRAISPSIGKMAPGDTLRVRTGTYHEVVKVNKANVVIEADEGHTPTLDGRWTPALFDNHAGLTDWNGAAVKADRLPPPTAANLNKTNWVLSGAGKYAYLVTIQADGVTLRGFVIRNVAGRGISLEGFSNVTIENNVIDFCYANNIQAKGCTNLVVRGNVMTRGSAKYWDPSHGAPIVDSCLFTKQGNGVLIENNVMAYAWGEGISPGHGTQNAIVRNNTAYSCYHASFYLGGCGKGLKFYGNVGYHTENTTDGVPNAGDSDVLAIVDEERAWKLIDPFIFNNVMVGSRNDTFYIANGHATKVADQAQGWKRAVSIDGGYIGFNTFVGSAHNSPRTLLFGQDNWYPHKALLVENNVFLHHPDNSNTFAVEEGAWTGNRVFRRNVYNSSLPAEIASGSDIKTATRTTPVLAKPFEPILGNFDRKSLDLPDPLDTTFDINNYRPVSGSPALSEPAIGAAGGITPPITKSYVGALDMIDEPVEPDPDPEPPPPDPEPEPDPDPEPPPPDPEPEPEPDPEPKPDWREGLEPRERDLLASAANYAAGPRGGFPGEGLILLADKLAKLLDG